MLQTEFVAPKPLEPFRRLNICAPLDLSHLDRFVRGDEPPHFTLTHDIQLRRGLHGKELLASQAMGAFP
jgi:hypothetical protein